MAKKRGGQTGRQQRSNGQQKRDDRESRRGQRTIIISAGDPQYTGEDGELRRDQVAQKFLELEATGHNFGGTFNLAPIRATGDGGQSFETVGWVIEWNPYAPGIVMDEMAVEAAEAAADLDGLAGVGNAVLSGADVAWGEIDRHDPQMNPRMETYADAPGTSSANWTPGDQLSAVTEAAARVPTESDTGQMPPDDEPEGEGFTSAEILAQAEVAAGEQDDRSALAQELGLEQ